MGRLFGALIHNVRWRFGVRPSWVRGSVSVMDAGGGPGNGRCVSINEYGLHVVCLLLLLMVWGCAQESEPESIEPGELVVEPLIAADSWRQVGADEDPFANVRAEDASCERGALTQELGGIEVDTGVCDHFSAVQPLLTDVDVGDTLTIVAWHSVLFFPGAEPATGHIALAIGDEVVWEQTSPIPGPANAWNESIDSPIKAPAGTPVTFHVRNHGNNTWNLLTFDVEKFQ